MNREGRNVAKAKPAESTGGQRDGDRPSLREEQKRLTRRKLVDAAKAVFHRKGYTDTTIDDIVEEAGASRGTYYLYFHNKADVLVELIDEYTEDAYTLLDDLAEIRDPTIDDLRHWLDSFVDHYGTHRLTIRAWIEAESNESTLHAQTDRNLNRFLDVLTDHVVAIRRDRFGEAAADAGDARTRAVLMVVQLERFCYFWLIRGWKVDRKTALSTMAELWHAAIFSDTSKR